MFTDSELERNRRKMLDFFGESVAMNLKRMFNSSIVLVDINTHFSPIGTSSSNFSQKSHTFHFASETASTAGSRSTFFYITIANLREITTFIFDWNSAKFLYHNTYIMASGFYAYCPVYLNLIFTQTSSQTHPLIKFTTIFVLFSSTYPTIGQRKCRSFFFVCVYA